jgi:dTDP-4-dehydrorhamnose reductase
MRTRVLITGGSGLLATNWALAIRDYCDVTLCFHERVVSLPGIDGRIVNLGDVPGLLNLFDDVKPDVVVHAAGLTSVEYCQNNEPEARYVNVALALNVAKASSSFGCKHVHISTDHLFSGRESLLNEEAECQPINVYGETKALAERKVLEELPDSLVIRTNFYGWGTAYRTSFSDFILNGLSKNNQTMLFADVYYTPIYVDQLVDAVMQLLQFKKTGIFNVVGNRRITKFDFGRLLASQTGLGSNGLIKSFIQENDELVLRPRDMSLSNSKLCRTLNSIIGDTEEGVLALLKDTERMDILARLK